MRSVFAAAALIFLLVSSSGAVCSVPQPRLICAEYFQEQVVVIARLISIRLVEPRHKQDYHIYSMRTERVLRGNIALRFPIFEESSSGRAGFDWRQGEVYLLFLTYIPEYKGWALDGCGNSNLLKRSGPVLKAIEKLQHGDEGGTIQGLVRFDQGATILVQGDGHTFKTTANEEGEFKIHVPAGRYGVQAVHKGKRFEVDLFSYENPKALKIANGGCAQVQFNVLAKK